MIDRLPDEHEVPSHRMTPIVVSFLAAVVVTLTLFGFLYWQSTQRADDLDRKAEALEESLTARAAVIDELAAGQLVMQAQLAEAGIKPAVPAPTQTIREVIRETGATGASGRDGRDGITPACWFEASQCVGPAGADSTVPGPAGPAPSDGSLDAAFLRYCETHQCKGDTGATGADSTVPGPQGQPGPPTECEAGHHWETVRIQGDTYRVCAAD